MTFCIKLLFSSSRLVQLRERERGGGGGRERGGEGGREGEGGRKVTGLVVNAALITW